MRKPRATGAGPANTGLKAKSFGDDAALIPHAGHSAQSTIEAQRLDREADILLFMGFRRQAERLAHAAAAMREMAA